MQFPLLKYCFVRKICRKRGIALRQVHSRKEQGHIAIDGYDGLQEQAIRENDQRMDPKVWDQIGEGPVARRGMRAVIEEIPDFDQENLQLRDWLVQVRSACEVRVRQFRELHPRPIRRAFKEMEQRCPAEGIRFGRLHLPFL